VRLVALLSILTLVGSCSSTDYLRAGRWSWACEATGDERHRVLGWMWAVGELAVTGRVLDADEVTERLGAPPHEYGERFAVVALDLTLRSEEAVVRGVAGGGLDDVRARAEELLGVRAGRPAKPLLPAGPHRDEKAGEPGFLDDVAKPLIASFAGGLRLPASIAETFPQDGGAVAPFSLFQRATDPFTRSGVFADTLLDDEEWKARARVRAQAYLDALGRWTESSAERVRAIDVVSDRVLAGRKCEARAGSVCTQLVIVDREDAQLAIEIDAELPSAAGCWPNRRLVAPLDPSAPLLDAAAAAAASLQPEAL
jgi:hypothetical protein